MITVDYICDLCGGHQPTDTQFWRVGVRVASPPNSTYSPAGELDCCRSCLEQRLGIHIRAETKAIPEFVPPTLEDAIREIVRNTVQEMAE